MRCTLPARYLPGQVLDLEYTDLDEQDGRIVFPRQQGVAIWSFSANNTRALMMAGMQEEGIPVFMEADDNYLVFPDFNIGDWHMRLKTAKYTDKHSFEGFKRTAMFADGMIVSTSFLADLYSRANKNIHICPNCVDPGDWPQAEHQERELVVGWAASDSHALDAGLINRALDWASRQDGVRVVVFGIKPNLTGYKFDYEYIPWVNTIEEYREKIGVIDLMLCPLRETLWSKAKSDIKCLEATMANAACVVSHAEPFKPWFDRTYTANTEKEFLKIVRYLCRNPDEVRELADSAREYVLSERTIQGNIGKWEQAIGSVICDTSMEALPAH